MKIVYADRATHIRCGHIHKYFTALKDLYGGQCLYEHPEWMKHLHRVGPRREPRQDELFNTMVKIIFDEHPDMAVIPGDAWPFWRFCQGAGVPYILLEEDIWSWRTGEESVAERQMIEGAAAIVFTSEDHQAHCAERYTLPPNAVVHLRPLTRDLSFTPLPKLPGRTLVYAGGLVPRWEDRKGLFGYRAYHRIFAAAIKAGWQVHAYNPYIARKLTDAVLTDHYGEYRELGVIPHPAVDNSDLYRELSQYTAGLHGYNLTDVPPAAANYVLGCRPNKCWEYLGAGIPTIGVNVGNSGEIFNGKWGTVLRWRLFRDLVAEFQKVARKLPIITDTMRFAQTIEQDYSTFRGLLDPILA